MEFLTPIGYALSMTKIFATLLLIVTVVWHAAGVADAYAYDTGSEFAVEILDNNVQVVEKCCLDEMGDKAVSSSCFGECYSLVSINVPASIWSSGETFGDNYTFVVSNKMSVEFKPPIS